MSRSIESVPSGVSGALGPIVLGLALVACGGAESVDGGSDSVHVGSDRAAGRTEQPKRVPLIGGEIPVGVLEGQPNLLIVTIDTLRADHLGLHGYPRGTSPFLDGLAAEAVVFDRAYAPIATTLPSHTTMFTGVHPHEHGVLANIADGRTYRRRSDLATLPELFQDAGYATGAIVSAYPLRPEFGLDSGFASYDAPKKRQRVANDTTTAALEMMAGQVEDGRPGLVWVHYFDPHGPYTPPYKFAHRFKMDDATRALLAERKFAERAQRPTGQWNELEVGVDAYDAEVAFVDRQIERLLFRAEEAGWLDDSTVVAVLADHGEGLNQHGVPGHGLVWEEQLHVPLLIRAPAVAPRRIAGPVTLADFAPTLLHLFDLPGKDAFLAQATGVDRFAPTTAHVDLPILGQSSPRQSGAEDIAYSLRVGRWKLHRDAAGRTSLYDLEADPFELADVAERDPELVERLSLDLDAILARQVGELRTEEASADAQSELRSLGYGGEDDR